ncbi:hypothetical protein FACS189483_01110 [Spirochaetia bacterium]|nr:hypothetical protein FACS189483_01110 [Spirochaetia bacterium]
MVKKSLFFALFAALCVTAFGQNRNNFEVTINSSGDSVTITGHTAPSTLVDLPPVLNPAPYPIPLVPVTESIIRRVQDNGKHITGFQYYISAAIILEREQRSETVQIFDTGEGLLEENVIREQIEIFPGAGGTFIRYHEPNPGASIIEICFDENDGNKTLIFRKNAVDGRFYLDYNRQRGTIVYAGQTYTLRMFDNTDAAYLLIRYYDPVPRGPHVQRLGGRSNRDPGQVQ